MLHFKAYQCDRRLTTHDVNYV